METFPLGYLEVDRFGHCVNMQVRTVLYKLMSHALSACRRLTKRELLKSHLMF